MDMAWILLHAIVLLIIASVLLAFDACSVLTKTGGKWHKPEFVSPNPLIGHGVATITIYL